MIYAHTSFGFSMRRLCISIYPCLLVWQNLLQVEFQSKNFSALNSHLSSALCWRAPAAQVTSQITHHPRPLEAEEWLFYDKNYWCFEARGAVGNRVVKATNIQRQFQSRAAHHNAKEV